VPGRETSRVAILAQALPCSLPGGHFQLREAQECKPSSPQLASLKGDGDQSWSSRTDCSEISEKSLESAGYSSMCMRKFQEKEPLEGGPKIPETVCPEGRELTVQRRSQHKGAPLDLP
jgi:hypothetical protein